MILLVKMTSIAITQHMTTNDCPVCVLMLTDDIRPFETIHASKEMQKFVHMLRARSMLDVRSPRKGYCHAPAVSGMANESFGAKVCPPLAVISKANQSAPSSSGSSLMLSMACSNSHCAAICRSLVPITSTGGGQSDRSSAAVGSPMGGTNMILELSSALPANDQACVAHPWDRMFCDNEKIVNH